MKYELKRVSMPNAFEVKLDLYDDSARFGFDIILNFINRCEAEKARHVFIKMCGVPLPWNVWEILFAYLKGANNND